MEIFVMRNATGVTNGLIPRMSGQCGPGGQAAKTDSRCQFSEFSR